MPEFTVALNQLAIIDITNLLTAGLADFVFGIDCPGCTEPIHGLWGASCISDPLPILTLELSTAIPEPATALVFACGLMGLATARALRRRV
jgi:hypothetical protein